MENIKSKFVTDDDWTITIHKSGIVHFYDNIEKAPGPVLTIEDMRKFIKEYLRLECQ